MNRKFSVGDAVKVHLIFRRENEEGGIVKTASLVLGEWCYTIEGYNGYIFSKTQSMLYSD